MDRRQFAGGLAALGATAVGGARTLGSNRRGMVLMKITDVRTVPVGRYLFVTVHTTANEGEEKIEITSKITIKNRERVRIS